MTDDRTNADHAVQAAVTALQGLTASIDKAWDEAIGKRKPPGVRGGFYSAAWLNEGTLAEREEESSQGVRLARADAPGTTRTTSRSASASTESEPEALRGPSGDSLGGESAATPPPIRKDGGHSGSDHRGGEPEATSPVSAPARSEAPSSSVIRDLTEDLSFTHDELRDLWKEPPSVSRARRYEAMGIVHEQAARLCRKLAGAWEVEEGKRA